MSLQRRKAALMPTGQLFYRRAKALVAEAARLERSAAELARGQYRRYDSPSM